MNISILFVYCVLSCNSAHGETFQANFISYEYSVIQPGCWMLLNDVLLKVLTAYHFNMISRCIVLALATICDSIIMRKLVYQPPIILLFYHMIKFKNDRTTVENTVKILQDLWWRWIWGWIPIVWLHSVCGFGRLTSGYSRLNTIQLLTFRSHLERLLQKKHINYFVIVQIHSWWRHEMETFSALLILSAGNSPVNGDIPAQRPVMRSFDVFFDLRLNKRLSKQREAGHLGRHHAHYDVIVMCYGRLCRYCTDNCNNGYPKICTRWVVFCFVLATLQFFANWYGLSNHIECDIIITLPIFLSQYTSQYTHHSSPMRVR